MDSRLADALQKFARNEIPAFRRPEGSPLERLDPADPLTFSRLCTYLAILRLDLPVISYEDGVTEGRDDCGFDGLAIALGNQTIANPDQAELLAEACVSLAEQGTGPARPRVLFVQSKRSPVCSNNEVKLFGVNALDFLSMRRRQWMAQKPNSAVLRWWEIYDRIREVYSRNWIPLEVEADLVFAYSGVWNEEKTRAESSRQAAEERLREQLGHPHARFSMWGSEEIALALLRTTPEVTNLLRGAAVVPLPPAPARGFLGYAPAASILALLPESGDSLDETMFTENVRSFLGLEPKHNPGAAGLAQTLDSGCGAEVILRHNGITIVAREARVIESDLELTEYQIVNGAQTAHVLHEKRDKLKDVHLAVKVVVTADEDLKNEVIRGANTQSPVDDYDMLSRLPYLRRLQEHFLSFAPSHPERLWMQRRRGERLLERDYDPKRVVTPRQLLEAFSATVLASPHTVHGHPGKCLEYVRREKIFAPKHSFTVYRALGCLLFAAREWAARKPGTRWMDLHDMPAHPSAFPARHQFLYALWLLADPLPDSPQLQAGSEVVEQRFGSLCEILTNPDQAKALTSRAASLLKATLRNGSRSAQVSRVSFTEKIHASVAGRVRRWSRPPRRRFGARPSPPPARA